MVGRGRRATQGSPPLNSRFFGAVHHSRRSGRGAQWSGDAGVAHGGQGRSGRGTGRRATQGSPPHIRTTPAPTDCKGVRRVINKEYKGVRWVISKEEPKVHFSDFGFIALILALGFAIYTGCSAVVGARRNSRLVLASAKRGVLVVAFFLVLSSAALIVSFLSHDFGVSYVAQHSSLAMPWSLRAA